MAGTRHPHVNSRKISFRGFITRLPGKYWSAVGTKPAQYCSLTNLNCAIARAALQKPVPNPAHVSPASDGAHLNIQSKSPLSASSFPWQVDRGEVGHAKLTGPGGGQIDHPAEGERTAIIDADGDNAAVVLVGDLHHGAERQGAMGGGEGTRILQLATRRTQKVTRYFDHKESVWITLAS